MNTKEHNAFLQGSLQKRNQLARMLATRLAQATRDIAVLLGEEEPRDDMERLYIEQLKKGNWSKIRNYYQEPIRQAEEAGVYE